MLRDSGTGIAQAGLPSPLSLCQYKRTRPIEVLDSVLGAILGISGAWGSAT